MAGDIKRLARLDRLEYDLERKAIAKRHGISVGTFDAEVKDEKERQTGK